MTFRPYTQIGASAVTDERSNNTGITINKALPLRLNASGELDFVNVAVEAEVAGVAGCAENAIPNGSKGIMVNSGKIEDISTTAAFGDPVYINKAGGLTNIQPSEGVNGFVAGDFVVSMGVIAKNELNPSLKDLIVIVDIVGQL